MSDKIRVCTPSGVFRYETTAWGDNRPLQPETPWVCGPFVIRPTILRLAGHKVDGHTHRFDHMTVVYTGAVWVRRTDPDGKVFEKGYKAPAHFLVKKDSVHEITATENGTEFWCMYTHRNNAGEVVDEFDGWAGAAALAE